MRWFVMLLGAIMLASCSSAANEEPDVPVVNFTDVEDVPVVNFTADGYESSVTWGEDWRPDFGSSNCEDRSAFPDVNLSSHGRFNLELITGKKFDQISKNDLTSMLQLEFSDWSEGHYVRSDSLESYEGLEYLTCLQWLRLGWKSLGSDFRFLNELTDLRYLDLATAAAFIHVEQLYALEKLETISLPWAFRSLNDLVAIPSLKRISAVGNKASCNIEPVLELPHLEVLLMKDSFYDKWSHPPGEDNDFQLSHDPSERYIELLQSGGAGTLNPPYDGDSLSGIHDDGYLFSLVQAIYEVVADSYDIIVFVGNDKTTEADHEGMAIQVSNDVAGLGQPIWSSASCYGSAGRLRGLVTFPTMDAFWQTYAAGSDAVAYSPFTHEVMHLWGGGDLLPIKENLEGIPIGGHWGVSSADGYLGGFSSDSLKVAADGSYKAGYFGPTGNVGLDRPLANLKKYIMGVLPASEVPDTTVFRGVSVAARDDPYGPTCSDDGSLDWEFSVCFRAEEKTSVSIEEIIKIHGERPYEGAVEISVLVVAVSESPLTGNEWSRLDASTSWHMRSSPIEGPSQNMWEASGGKISFDLPTS